MDSIHVAVTIEHGKILCDRKALRELIAGVPDGPYVLKLEKPKAIRSTQANRYYWGVVIPLMAEHWGYTKDGLHEALKWEFLRVENPDFPLPTVKSTADLNPEEFTKYLDQVMQLAAEDGIVIPEAA